MADASSVAHRTTRCEYGIHRRERFRRSSKATRIRSSQSHFRLMADASSLALRTNRCGYGIHRRERCRTCSKATRIRSSQSHFRLMAGASSLAHRTNRCGYGIHRRERCRTCSKATRNRSGQSHFRLMADTLSLAQGTNRCGYGIHRRERCRTCSKATRIRSGQSHFRLMADASSLAHRTIWCGYGIHRRERCRTCSKATQIRSRQSHFRLMADALSLAHRTNWCRYGIHQRERYRTCSNAIQWGCPTCFCRSSLLPTSGRSLWVSHINMNILAGWSLLTAGDILCLCHLMNDCLTPPIYSLYHALALLPLISLRPLWVFDGWIAILYRLVFYFVIPQLATSGWHNATAFVKGRFPFLFKFAACSTLLTQFRYSHTVPIPLALFAPSSNIQPTAIILVYAQLSSTFDEETQFDGPSFRSPSIGVGGDRTIGHCTSSPQLTAVESR